MLVDEQLMKMNFRIVYRCLQCKCTNTYLGWIGNLFYLDIIEENCVILVPLEQWTAVDPGFSIWKREWTSAVGSFCQKCMWKWKNWIQLGLCKPAAPPEPSTDSRQFVIADTQFGTNTQPIWSHWCSYFEFWALDLPAESKSEPLNQKS